MLDDLTAEEVAMLAHALRMVPGNACLLGKSLRDVGGSGVGFFTEIPAYKSLWEKVARTIAERPDLKPFHPERSQAI